MRHCIYKIKNKINEKVYIGQTINFEKRIKEHINTERTTIGKAITKYGVENFSFEIIQDNINEKRINKLEKYYINKVYNSYKGKGYNCTPGGEKLNGKDNPFYGRTHTKEVINKIKENNSGENSPWFGKKHTEKEKDKIRKTHSKYNKNEYIKIYNEYKNTNLSYKDLCKKYELGKSTIARIVNANHWATEHLDKINKKVKTAHYQDNHPNSKLSKKECEDIYFVYKNSDKSYNNLAKKYNVAKCTIGRIVRKEHWATKNIDRSSIKGSDLIGN